MKKTAVFAWAALLLIVLFWATPAVAYPPPVDGPPPPGITKYIDALPQPPIATPTGKYQGKDLYDIYLKAVKVKIHSELDSTPVFAFNGVYPGPTFLVSSGVGNWVYYHNQLPANHMFNVDTTIPVMAGMGWGQSSRFVSHLHGGDVESKYDGWCMDFVYPGETLKYYYPNSQRATTLWYHDHSCGVTRLNAYAGIAGFYIITDKYERKQGLPAGAHELGIALQDRSFNDNGTLFYPDSWQAEFFGNVAVVNGKAWPKLEVDPAKYRIHFLAGGNDRFWNIKLIECDASGNIPVESVPGPGICQIGSDQGLLSNAVMFYDTDPWQGRLLMEPGARYDVVIDFKGQRGKYFLVHNNAQAPFDGTYPPPEDMENPLFETFLIYVKDVDYTDNAKCPMTYITPNPYNAMSAFRTRDWAMTENIGEGGYSLGLQLNHHGFMDGIFDTVQLGTREIWRYINTTMDMHPMHIHLVAFNILDRTPFDVDNYLATGQIVFTGPPELPPANERGQWKDEVMSPPGYVSRVIAQYNRTGKYVTHCHILGHEENDMMAGFIIMPTRDTAFGGSMVADVTPLEPSLTVTGSQPFRGHASIAYSAGVEGRARLTIYNSLGQAVKSLVNGTVNRGLHTAVWDGTDKTGAPVAAGSYFYKLETPKYSQTVRATLLR